MKGIKLVDVDLSEARTEQTGTCELCFGSMWCDNPILIFENPYGDRVKIDGYFWSWGDYLELEIDNYLNFSDWLSKQDVDWFWNHSKQHSSKTSWTIFSHEIS